MQQLQKHSEVPFDLVFLVMDPGYNARNREKIQENAKLMQVPITVFESDIFAASESASADNPCYLCARMRRGHLYAKAKELGCNKIALGHHKSDVIETTVMGMLLHRRPNQPPREHSTTRGRYYHSPASQALPCGR